MVMGYPSQCRAQNQNEQLLKIRLKNKINI